MIRDTVLELLARSSVLLIVLGIALFVLGAAGGARPWLAVNDNHQQYALETFGAILTVIGVVMSLRQSTAEI
jgi:hypothetical protein